MSGNKIARQQTQDDNLFIGTCSWKYPTWKDLVYSQSDGINYLEEYSGKYNTVEIDQWFWSLFGEDKIKLPNSKEVEDYVNSVPNNFKFTIKAPNTLTLTHFKGKKGEDLTSNPYFLSSEIVMKFLNSIHVMENNIGSIMLQFGYLNMQKMKSPLEFFNRLDSFLFQIPHSNLFSVETRNKNYLKPQLFDILLNHNSSPVLLQGYWMDNIWDTFNMFKNQILKFDKVIIRLHGDDREGIEKKSNKRWDSIITNRDNELEKVSEMVKQIRKNNAQVYINVNNHYEGSAPLTIKKLQALI